MPHIKTPNATKITATFPTRCFAPGDTIALCLRRESPAGILQRRSLWSVRLRSRRKG